MKRPSQTNTGPLRQTKNTPRETQVPLRPTKCFLGQKEGLHELIEGACSRTECPLRPARGMVSRVYRHLRILEISLATFILLCPRSTQTWGKKRFSKILNFQGVHTGVFVSHCRIHRKWRHFSGKSLACRHCQRQKYKTVISVLLRV